MYYIKKKKKAKLMHLQRISVNVSLLAVNEKNKPFVSNRWRHYVRMKANVFITANCLSHAFW